MKYLFTLYNSQIEGSVSVNSEGRFRLNWHEYGKPQQIVWFDSLDDVVEYLSSNTDFPLHKM